MKKIAALILTTLVSSMLAVVATVSAPAFAAVNPIDCANVGMLQVITDNGVSVTVYEMDVTSDPVNASLIQLFQEPLTGTQDKFNGVGVNPIDNQLYGSLKHTDGKGYFVRLGDDGFEYLFEFDTGHNYIADFDENGNYIYNIAGYTKISGADQLQGYASQAAVDAANPTDTSVAMTNTLQGASGADIAVIIDDGDTIIVSVQNDGDIVIHNVTDDIEVIVPSATAGTPAGNQWGAAYAFGDSVFASENKTAGIIQIPWKNYLNGNTNAQVVEVVANSALANYNDGANCKDVPPPPVPCGFPGLSGITADDPACVETTTINIVDPIDCANVNAVQHVNSNALQSVTTGSEGTSPFTYNHAYLIDPQAGNVQSFSPNWQLNLANYGIAVMNATAINPLDDKMYGYVMMTDNTTFAVVRFDQFGDLEFVHSGMGSEAYTGAFTPDGTYVIQNGLTAKPWTNAGLHALGGWATQADRENNFTTNNWVEGANAGPYIAADWAVVTASNGDYIAIGVSDGSHPYDVLQYNITTGVWTETDANLPDLGNSSWGAAYSYADNSVYVSMNNGSGLYKVLWDQPLINNEIQLVQTFEQTSITNSNDGASCIDELPNFPCAYDESINDDDPNCEPNTDFTVVNNLQCQKNNADRTFSITNDGDVSGTFTITNEDNNQQYQGVELEPGQSFTWNFETGFSIVDDAVNDFRLDIDWIDTDNDVSYIITIPTFIGNYVDCDPKAPVEWTNNPCSNVKEASLEIDLTETIHDLSSVTFTFDGGSLVGSDPLSFPVPPLGGYANGLVHTFDFDIDEQSSNSVITVVANLVFSNGVTRQHQFTHGTQDCLQSAFDGALNWNCAGSSYDYNNTGDYPAVITLTNNGVTNIYTYQPGESGSIPLGWAEDSTNTLTVQGSFVGDPQTPPATILSTFTDKKVNCVPPTVQIEENDEEYKFTLTPPCAVSDYGIIAIDTDPNTPGTQITDEFTYSIELLPNGDLEITVDDIDDDLLDGTTLDSIMVYWSGPDCVDEDCEPTQANTCEIEIEIEVIDDDDEELPDTGAGQSEGRLAGLAIILAFLGYGLFKFSFWFIPTLSVRILNYRDIRSSIRIDGSRKRLTARRKERRDE